MFRFNQPETTYFFITADNVKVGVIRVVDFKDCITRKRISPIFIMPEYRNKGYAQGAIKEARAYSRQSSTGSSTLYYKKKGTAICMKSSVITKRVKPSESTIK